MEWGSNLIGAGYSEGGQSNVTIPTLSQEHVVWGKYTYKHCIAVPE